MNIRRNQSAKSAARQAKGRNTFVNGRTWQRRPKQARRSSMGQRNARLPFAPPENWYDPAESDGSETQVTESASYKVIMQPPGDGYRHVITPEQVRGRVSTPLRSRPSPCCSCRSRSRAC